jgi:hypothetical protein
MSNILGKTNSILITLALSFATSSILAQSPAPRPSQLTSAKTVFISNATNAFSADNKYDEFYAAIHQTNHFTVVLAPTDADIILEYSTDTNSDGDIRHLLRVVDTKTHVLLWSVSEPQKAAGREATIQKNQLDAINHLAADINTLSGGGPITPTPPVTLPPCATPLQQPKTRIQEKQ